MISRGIMIDARGARNREWFIAVTTHYGGWKGGREREKSDRQEESSSKAINSYVLVSAKNG